MIFQSSPVQTKTQALAQYNKGLIQARHIQARLKEAVQNGSYRSSTVANAFLASLNSWFD